MIGDPIARDFALLKLSRQYTRIGVSIQFLARGGQISITKIEVDTGQRCKGLARLVLTEVCTWADTHGHTLGITPTEQWGADVARLAVFYASLGFVANRQEPRYDTMIRKPCGRKDTNADG